MSRKIHNGERVILRIDYLWPVIVTVIELLPKKQFYIQYDNGYELVVQRKNICLVSSGYRLLQSDEKIQEGDYFRAMSLWKKVFHWDYAIGGTAGSSVYRRRI